MQQCEDYCRKMSSKTSKANLPPEQNRLFPGIWNRVLLGILLICMSYSTLPADLRHLFHTMDSSTLGTLPEIAFPPFQASQHVIDLSGPGWTLENSNGSIAIPASIPSQAHVDLLRNGLIENPLFGFNDDDQLWVARSNWTYTSPPLNQLQISASPFSLLSEDTETYLVFGGLDTFARITLCGQEVANTDNMFLQYVFDVTDILKQCQGSDTRLSINFGGAIAITHKISETIGDAIDNHVNSCKPENEFGCKIYARKQANDFGWDWSPSLVPAGPWKPIYAVQISTNHKIYIKNTAIDIYRQGQMNNIPPDQSQPWIFNASLDFFGNLPPHSYMQMILRDGGRIATSSDLRGIQASNGTITGSTSIDAKTVELWWPNGLGSQKLYTAEIRVLDASGRLLATIEKRVGFRTIVLNLDPITKEEIGKGMAPGNHWHFEVNGQEMFAKGSNLVPPNTFWSQANVTTMRHLFKLAKEANFNMFRVWSSGAYLDDFVYDIADEMGILLWSEFQFSDAEYPTDPHYLANYEDEAYYQVRRTSHHPSLALWAGGNELEQILLAFFFDADEPTEITLRYQQIFEKLLIKCVYANTRSISYIPSSTYHGYLSLDFDSDRPQLARYKNTTGPDYLYANSDYYNYDARTAFDIKNYPIGRFATEFGFISLSNLQTWETAAPPEDLYVESPTVVHHNRHAVGPDSHPVEENRLTGLGEMTKAVPMWYPTPHLSDPVANFSAWIYTTQVFQSEFIINQIAFYRRGSGMRERNMGSLYWMFNDLWACSSWSSIDSTGRQKLFYYGVKDIYSPVIVYPYHDTSTSELQVWVTSDLFSAVSGTLEVEWIDWSGNKISVPADSSSMSFKVGAINSTQVLKYDDVLQTLSSEGIRATDALLRLSITAEGDGNTYKHTSYFHPSSLAKAHLLDPELKLVRNSAKSFTVTATEAVAAWVWLEYATNAVTGYWSDNGFWLNKGESRTVTFTVWDDWSAGKWVDTVGVRSLWNNTLT